MKGFIGLVDGSLSVILGILLGFVALTEGYVHYVGGRDGWVLSPSESYNHWAENTRFQVNDSLVFSYARGDSILVVNETDYNTCNPNNPIQSLHGGYSVFKLDRSGPFYFITGITNRCYKGQKMVIVVMAMRKITPNMTPATSPFPSISLPPIGGILPPNAAPVGAVSPSPVPGAGTGVGIASAPMSGGPSAAIAPASGPAVSGPSGPGMGFTPASAPNVPETENGVSAVSIGLSSVFLGLGLVILDGVI